MPSLHQHLAPLPAHPVSFFSAASQHLEQDWPVVDFWIIILKVTVFHTLSIIVLQGP